MLNNHFKQIQHKCTLSERVHGLQIGEQKEKDIVTKVVINLDFFKAHYEEVMAMREQIILIKNMLSAINETQKETTKRLG